MLGVFLLATTSFANDPEASVGLGPEDFVLYTVVQVRNPDRSPAVKSTYKMNRLGGESENEIRFVHI